MKEPKEFLMDTALFILPLCLGNGEVVGMLLDIGMYIERV